MEKVKETVRASVYLKMCCCDGSIKRFLLKLFGKELDRICG